MPEPFIKITPIGLDKVIAALDKFPREIARYLGQAGDESAKRVVFPTEGIKKYPPRTYLTREEVYGQPFVSDKQRRYFFAALRSGEIEVPYRRGQSPKSERYGTQWYSETTGYQTEIGNRASYAKWLAGDDQSQFAAASGWRKLADVVDEKMENIKKVYQAWVDKLIRDLGL